MSKKRNKSYKPKSIRLDAHTSAITLVQPVREDSIQELLNHVSVALTAFTNGAADKSHFDILASMVDMCMMASRSMFSMAYTEEIEAARNAMIRTRARYANTGKLGLDGEGLQAIKTAAWIYEQQLNNLTGSEVLGMLKARHYHIISGNFYRGN